MKRIETRFNNWRYFGYDRETFLHYQGELFQNNLKRSYQHAIMLLLVCVMSLPLFLFVDHNPANVIAVVLEMALSFLLASWARRLRHSSATPQVRSINALVICVSLSCYLCSIFVSCVGNGNDLAVTAIWVILVVQFIYIQPAIQNLLISFPCLLVLMACSLLVKTPDKSVYDCVHAFITFVIGQYVSWFNTRSRLELIIASDKLRHVNYALYHASVTDTLTGLDNRKLIFAKYKELSAKCADDNSKMACIVIDADNFKAYNDLYGHPAGDDLLSTLGKFFSQFAEAKHLNTCAQLRVPKQKGTYG